MSNKKRMVAVKTLQQGAPRAECAFLRHQESRVALIDVEFSDRITPCGESYDPKDGNSFFVQNSDDDAATCVQLIGYENWEFFSISATKRTAHVCLFYEIEG